MKRTTFMTSKRIYLVFILLCILTISCDESGKPKSISSINHENWSKRKALFNTNDSLEYGKSYLSIYSQIYSHSEHKKHSLTAMVSLRNTSDADTLYLMKVAYYNTTGDPIRSYIKDPIYLVPLETAEIIIDEIDVEGGTGSNFIIEWKIPPSSSEPIFECVMNSTIGSKALAFTTHAVRIK